MTSIQKSIGVSLSFAVKTHEEKSTKRKVILVPDLLISVYGLVNVSAPVLDFVWFALIQLYICL